MSSTTAATAPITPGRAYIILVFSVFAFGFTGVFAHMAESPGLVVATWRVAVATLVLAIPFFRQPESQRRLNRALWRQVFIGATFFAMSVGIFHIALDYTAAANAAFLGNMAPISVGVITLVFLKDRLPRLFWPGVAVALAGAALIVFGTSGIGQINTGDLIVLSNSLVWALYQIITARARVRISTLTWVWLVVGISTIYLVPLCLLSGYHLTDYATPTILAMIGSGLVSQAGGFIGYNFALGHISAARVSVVNLLQPVVTAVFAFLLLAEDFGGWRLVGGALVIAGVYLVNRRERPPRS
jgi:drug/metabolite transporter (DMT)-like permease